jgi:ABC-type uncharacterized transport system permease subunit
VGNSFRLFQYFIRANLSAHFANLPNLISGALGMIINNCIFLAGMWGMLFAGKPENESFAIYYVALNALFMLAWGAINFLMGGFQELGELIVSGQFESKLSTPRHPLWLVGFHGLHPSALGDFLMGLFGIGLLFYWGRDGLALRILFGSGLTFFSLFGLFVITGSLAFYVPRGNQLAQLFREMTVSLSVYPLERVFSSGLGRWLLLATPAGFVTLLPMHWVESGSGVDLIVAAGGVVLFDGMALLFYTLGVKKFQTVSLIGTQA